MTKAPIPTEISTNQLARRKCHSKLQLYNDCGPTKDGKVARPRGVNHEKGRGLEFTYQWVSWSTNNYSTGVNKPVYGYQTYPLTASGV